MLQRVVVCEAAEVVSFETTDHSTTSTSSSEWKVSGEQAWDMMKSIYDGTSFFCQTRTEKYPPPPSPPTFSPSPAPTPIFTATEEERNENENEKVKGKEKVKKETEKAQGSQVDSDVSPAFIAELLEHRRTLTTALNDSGSRLSPPMYLLICLTDDIPSSPSASDFIITLDPDPKSGEDAHHRQASSHSASASTSKLEPVGFVKVVPNRVPRLAHTSDLTMGLVPRVCGKGIGKFALDETLSRLKRTLDERRPRGLAAVEIVYLMVREDNEPARALYRKAGFEQAAVLTKDTKISNDLYYDGILMRKFLI